MRWNDGTDLGSIESTGSSDNKWNFQFLTPDLSKLPTDVAAGSSAIDLNTGEVYLFHLQTKAWKKI